MEARTCVMAKADHSSDMVWVCTRCGRPAVTMSPKVRECSGQFGVFENVTTQQLRAEKAKATVIEFEEPKRPWYLDRGLSLPELVSAVLFGLGLTITLGTVWWYAFFGISSEVGTALGFTAGISLVLSAITWIGNH